MHSLLSPDEIVFLVDHAAEGGFSARADRAAIFTQADGIAELWDAARDAVACHFDPDLRPSRIRLRLPDRAVVDA
jgi:hypothetical protein